MPEPPWILVETDVVRGGDMAGRVASKSGLSSVGMMMAGDCFLSRSSFGRKTCSSRQDQDSLSAWRGGQEYPGPDA